MGVLDECAHAQPSYSKLKVKKIVSCLTIKTVEYQHMKTLMIIIQEEAHLFWPTIKRQELCLIKTIKKIFCKHKSFNHKKNLSKASFIYKPIYKEYFYNLCFI